MERILSYRARLQKVMAFAENVYVPDLLEVAKVFPQYFEIGRGRNNFLSYGVFPHGRQRQQVHQGGCGDRRQMGALDQEEHPRRSGLLPLLAIDRVGIRKTARRFPKPKKPTPTPGSRRRGIAASRWKSAPCPRIMVNYLDPSGTWIKNEVDAFLASVKVPAEKLNSVLGRHAARGLETLWVGKQADKWLDELEVDGPPAAGFHDPEDGLGLWTDRSASRRVGALAVDRQLSDQELPVRRADHLELLAARRQRTARARSSKPWSARSSKIRNSRSKSRASSDPSTRASRCAVH